MRTALVAGLLCACPVFATLTVTLTPSVPSPQAVGTTITWTPTAVDSNPGAIDYRYSVAASGQSYQVLQDFDVASTFSWTPYVREGSFNVEVTARNVTSGEKSNAAVLYTITPLTTAVGGPPVITATPNPLVALYSAPGCPTGSSVRVRFSNGTTTQRTAGMACSPTSTSNFYVAGMLPSTVYQMDYEIVKGGGFTSGPLLAFTTGIIPANLTFPTLSLAQAGSTDTQQSVMLFNALPEPVNQNYFPFATDLAGHIIWYYTNVPVTEPYNFRPVTGGTILMLVAIPSQLNLTQQLVREIDLAGNTIRQTSTTRMSQQLTALGKYPIISVNHDVVRLPNGHTLLLASQEKIYPAGTQGSTGPVDIIGDCIIDLDTNFQVAWSWSAYDFLDINRPAVLGETCVAGQFGCPPIKLASIANDWTHGNSLYYRSDGNILFSSRHQDLLYKIDYANGAGAGDVLWTMGLGGDFTMTGTSDPYPWFSHQHDAEFANNGTTLLTLYDNGNTRISENPGEHSRGQALNVDESSLTVSLALNQDMGTFSQAIGSAQLLDNGDYFFDSGWVIPEPGQITAYSQEITPAGLVNFQIDDSTRTYRVYRMSTLYSEQ